MTPSRTLLNRMADLFAANTTLLGVAAASEIKVQAVDQAFTPSLDNVLADVPVHGSPLNPVALNVSTDAVPFFYTDTLTGEHVATLPFAIGVDHFRGGAGTYPFTIHGVRLVSADGLTLLAVERLDTPVPFSASNDGFRSPRITFRFPPTMIR